MIVFCGVLSELPLAVAIEAAGELGIEYLVLNQRHFQFYDIRLDAHAGRISGMLWVLEREWPLERVRGVYTRLGDVPDVPEHRPRRLGDGPSETVPKATFVHNTLNAWFECAPCRVANRRLPSSNDISRLYQYQLVRRAGFLIPPTLLTNDPTEVLAFQRRHQRVIYESTSTGRSIVRELTPETARDLDRIRHLPTEFQAYVPGTDVRVHVVGAEVFATRIVSAAVDSRYAQQDGLDVTMEPITLSDEVEVRCRELSRNLELPFCGIDLRVTPDGQYYCFEVDPSPVFSDYQEGSGQPIAHALVSYLAGRQSSVS